jgi:hypothetical protein
VNEFSGLYQIFRVELYIFDYGYCLKKQNANENHHWRTYICTTNQRQGVHGVGIIKIRGKTAVIDWSPIIGLTHIIALADRCGRTDGASKWKTGQCGRRGSWNRRGYNTKNVEMIIPDRYLVDCPIRVGVLFFDSFFMEIIHIVRY